MSSKSDLCTSSTQQLYYTVCSISKYLFFFSPLSKYTLRQLALFNFLMIRWILKVEINFQIHQRYSINPNFILQTVSYSSLQDLDYLYDQGNKYFQNNFQAHTRTFSILFLCFFYTFSIIFLCFFYAFSMHLLCFPMVMLFIMCLIFINISEKGLNSIYIKIQAWMCSPSYL